ncbi:MAG: PEPxxWA-CTERM sorting domain-containing protein [Sphingobium sp.]|nr:PEPxxWA-CTERM sorting domain-containing protein [Sphingobium sp.]
MKSVLYAATCVAALAIAIPASAQITRVSEGDFAAAAGLITFSEFAVNTVNPVYTPADYGGGPGAPTVHFDGWFLGQSLSANPGVDCPGAAASACVVGNPVGPLQLDPASIDTFITTDGSFPSSPTLTGAPRFNGPIAILFDRDLAGVGFEGGYFNAIGSTGITAFDVNGNLLGTVVNTSIGIEFLGLVTTDGTEKIRGVFLDLVGAEPAGFNIDNLRFGTAGQVTVPGVPEPASWAMMISGLAIVGSAMRRRVAKIAFA